MSPAVAADLIEEFSVRGGQEMKKSNKVVVPNRGFLFKTSLHRLLRQLGLSTQVPNDQTQMLKQIKFRPLEKPDSRRGLSEKDSVYH